MIKHVHFIQSESDRAVAMVMEKGAEDAQVDAPPPLLQAHLLHFFFIFHDQPPPSHRFLVHFRAFALRRCFFREAWENIFV